jgi:hypothetical protein
MYYSDPCRTRRAPSRAAAGKPRTAIRCERRTFSPFIRLAVLGTAVVGLVFVTPGRATAQHAYPSSAPGSGYGPPIPAPVQPIAENSDRSFDWLLFAAAVLGALALVAVVADVLGRRRWRQPRLETALASTDARELPRAAGLLGDRLVRQRHTDAAEHAYRAAIVAGDAYWSPIAQVALADLLSDRGERAEAQALLEATIASGHPRAVEAARTSLDQLQSRKSQTTVAGALPQAYETLGRTRG